MNKSSKSGAKSYKSLQNDVPYANSVVSTINENDIRKFHHYLQTYISSAQENLRMLV